MNCLHPATYMNTTMVKMDGLTPATSVEEGAEAILNLAVGPQVEGKTGLYFDGLRQSRPIRQASDLTARARLRTLSYQLVNLEKPATHL